MPISSTSVLRSAAHSHWLRSTTSLARCCRHFSVTPVTMAPPQSALEFLDFVNASPTRESSPPFPRSASGSQEAVADSLPTAYHAVAQAVTRLEAAGFKGIKERDNWGSELLPGGKVRLRQPLSHPPHAWAICTNTPTPSLSTISPGMLRPSWPSPSARSGRPATPSP